MSEARLNPKPLTRSKAWTCVVINQLAFPGMGTVMAGRWSGYAQATIMLAGFFLTMGFMFFSILKMFVFIVHADGGEVHYREICRPYAWAGFWGLSLCLVAWCWALASSIAILRGAASSRRLDTPDQKG